MDWRMMLILGMALATYFTRVTPFFFHIRQYRFLKFVPASVFASLIFPDLARSVDNLIAGLLVFAVACKNRDLLVAFLTGVFALYLLKIGV